MFEYISGKLAIKKIDYVALEINGLAYKIHIFLRMLRKTIFRFMGLKHKMKGNFLRL